MRRNRSVRRTALRHRSVPMRLHVWHRRRPRRVRHAAKLDDDGGVELYPQLEPPKRLLAQMMAPAAPRCCGRPACRRSCAEAGGIAQERV